MTLLLAIERCLRTYKIPPSRFGRQAASDPRLVYDLRRGREMRADTERRIRAYIAQAGTEISPPRAASTTAGPAQ